MKTSRQQKRRSAPGDVAPPVQKYSDRECIRWLLKFLRCDLAALRPHELLALRNEVFPYLHCESRATLTIIDEDELLAHGPLPPRRPGVDARHVIAAAREFMGGVQDELRAGPAGPPRVAHPLAAAVPQAHRLGRSAHRRNPELLQLAAPTPQASEVDQHARAAQ